MISVEMTVFEMVTLCSLGINAELQARIIAALEKATNQAEKVGKSVLRVYSINNGRFIDCIKIIRKHTDMGLREAKNFMDVVRGDYVPYSHEYEFQGGRPNDLKGYSREICVKIVSDLLLLDGVKAAVIDIEEDN